MLHFLCTRDCLGKASENPLASFTRSIELSSQTRLTASLKSIRDPAPRNRQGSQDMANVEIILKEKVEGLGAEADVVKVRRGFARNFLLPRGVALEASRGNLLQLEGLKKARASREAAELEQASKIANRINKQRLKLTLSTGQGGKAFGSITTKDIQEALAGTDAGIELDRKAIKLDAPIKSSGKFDIPVSIHPDVDCRIRLQVEAEGATEEG